MKIALATMNPIVGDLDGNGAKILAARAATPDADLIIFSELVLIGYPPEDLVLKPAFQRDAMDKVMELAAATNDGGPALLIGSCWVEGGDLYNSALLLDKGKLSAVRHKHDLPNYGVFDEKRIFTAGPLLDVVDFRGVKLGLLVCEDMWTEEGAVHLTNKGADILVVLNGSPYEAGKGHARFDLACDRVRETSRPLIYVNQVGGQDELVFDGGSFVVNANGELAQKMTPWCEDILVTNWQDNICEGRAEIEKENRLADMYQAMMLGLRDYVQKNHFPGVVLGMSGGIDSAISAVVAVDALGAENVRLVMMPSRYTGEESLLDAADCAAMLGCTIENMPIEDAVQAYDKMLSPAFAGTEPDTTEENLQSRIRAVLLMGLSNKFGAMLLTTGNKSEMSVGYATLYGDMCGGFSVLKDIYKMDVFALSRWRNENLPRGGLGPRGRIMPENIIEKPPTAELRPDQKDEDSLPPYEELDDILECLVEREMSFKDIVARGHEVEVVARIEHLLYIAEYKRRQAPPGVKITQRNFGRDRRYPITNGYRTARSEK